MNDEMPEETPTFEHAMINAMMMLNEHATIAKRLAMRMDHLNFSDLTPGVWAEMSAQAESVGVLAEYIQNAAKMSGILIDDEDSMTAVRRVADDFIAERKADEE